MAERKLFDNLFKVIKVNSGSINTNDAIFTEIIDLQIPRGFCARIRKVIWEPEVSVDQLDQGYFRMLGALILDPDDELTIAIPAFAVDHDVCCDFSLEMLRYEEGVTPVGIGTPYTLRETINFDETLDVVTVRNVRFNTLGTAMKVDGDNKPQLRIEVYFTYEKISADLYAKLLGIS